MTIQNDKVVTMHFHLTDSTGQMVDSSRGNDPLTYLHGAGSLVPGLERELTGLDVGATKTVHVAAAEGYGERDASRVQSIPLQALAGLDDIRVGSTLKGRGPDGQTVTGMITDIQDDTELVILDTNHPLAGVDLTFEIEILAVRDATAEELTHGHAHGAEGHSH